MVFTETIIPSGQIVYKGFGKISCETLLRDTRIFFVADKLRTARDYGRACKYKVKRTLRLFDLTHANITELFKSGYKLSAKTKRLLKIAVGTTLTVGQQVRAIRKMYGEKETRDLPPESNTGRGERLSYVNLNKEVFNRFAYEFLTPEGYDGYYAPKKKSVFHGGTFSSEIMLVNAYQTIERFVNRTQTAPVISTRSVGWALPRIFTEFCKGRKELVRPFGRGLVLFCTGGMGIRLLLQKKTGNLKTKIRRTSDFDFTFAVPHQFPSQKEVGSYVEAMRRIMTDFLEKFIEYLNKTYSGINARLRVNRMIQSPYYDPRIQVPGTRRRVYQVIRYQIQTGKNEVTDLIDTALAVYPGVDRTMIDIKASHELGIPIQKLKYQLRDALAIVSGSFLYKGVVAQRNPLVGKVKEKGQKNVARIKSLLNIAPNSQLKNTARIFIQNIEKRNIKKARQTALKVNAAVKKIV
jgi:hypothetical protein